jgi:hypothetical protein
MNRRAFRLRSGEAEQCQPSPFGLSASTGTACQTRPQRPELFVDDLVFEALLLLLDDVSVAGDEDFSGPFAFDVPAMLPLLVSIGLGAALSVPGLVVLPIVPLAGTASLLELDDDVPLLPYEVPLLCVVDALPLLVSLLCLNEPIANAEPLARAMMEVTTNAGASLRIVASWWPVWFGGITCEHLVASPMPRIDARWRASTCTYVNFFRMRQKKCRPRRAGIETTDEIRVTSRTG